MRSKITYANVVSTIALFLALGGGVYAYALGRNEVKSKHIAPGQVKASDTAKALGLQCPGGTRLFQGACIETAPRQATMIENAHEDCLDEGRRLPSVAELEGFRHAPGIALGSEAAPSEWTNDPTIDPSGALHGDIEILVTETETTVVPGGSGSEALYRCVAMANR